WFKIDFVSTVKEVPFNKLEQRLSKTRRNYFRSGISFDPEFRFSLLEQEINGNAMIRSVKKGPIQLNEQNINHYLKLSGSFHYPFIKNRYQQKNVFLFKTIAAFTDIHNTDIHDLYSGGLTNGIRKVSQIQDEVEKLIYKSTYFLVDQVQADGQFNYGY